MGLLVDVAKAGIGNTNDGNTSRRFFLDPKSAEITGVDSRLIYRLKVKTLFEQYEKYKNESLQEKHGKTPQIYLIYVQLIDYYLMLEFSIRTSDFDLFKYVLRKMTNILFTMSHQNYARYLSVYLNQLENIGKTHPGLLEDSKDCFLGFHRTSKPFSRIPKDLTMEQTQNADAASKASGVINLTDSFSARQKWSVTHSLRTSMISKLMEFCGMRQKDDITKELRKSSIENSSSSLSALLDFFKQCTNPFSSNLSKDHLYSVSSGRSVSDQVFEFLSTVETTGEKQRNTFFSESQSNAERFDKAIKKTLF